MEVKNKTMFHIHSSNKYDNIWKPGNEIIVDNNFNSECGLTIYNFNTNIKSTAEDFLSLEGYLKEYLDWGVENIDVDTLKLLLEKAYQIIHNANRCKYEVALEICRQKHFKLYPSRLHSIWVTDEDNLEFWLEQLPGKEIFELDLTGTLFKTSDYYIPDDHLSLSQAIKVARLYWNPIFNKEAEARKEYLFQGKVLIKRRIENPNCHN